MEKYLREDVDSNKIDSNKIEIRTSSISGNGTFAKKKILNGEYITTLSGEPFTSTPDVSLICESKGISGDDPLQIGETKFLILNYASKTINHSCHPNAGIKNVSDLFALKDINVDEEITYDYSTTSGTNDTWNMICGCNAKTCRKKIGNVLTLPPATLVQYVLQDCLPEFIKRQLSRYKSSIRNKKPSIHSQEIKID